MEDGCPDKKKLKKINISVPTDEEINAELKRRGVFQYIDEGDNEPHWDAGKLYFARKMFKEGIKWVLTRNETQA